MEMFLIGFEGFGGGKVLAYSAAMRAVMIKVTIESGVIGEYT